MNDGVSLSALRRDFSAAGIRESIATVADLERESLVSCSGGDRVALTSRGRLLSNDVFERFLSERAAA